jgi:hypothetical protein
MTREVTSEERSQHFDMVVEIDIVVGLSQNFEGALGGKQ